MREDMFKVIVERPRSGRSWATKSKLRYDKCEDRSSVTGHRLVMEASGGTKYLNENLAPLKRYLHKQVGRVWNDVFSEICQHLDTGSTVKMHVREHLDDFVLRNVTCNKAGALIATTRWGTPEPVVDCWAKLYVDPFDGRLKLVSKLCAKQGVATAQERAQKNRVRYLRTRKTDKPVRKLSDLSWRVRLKGIWYQVDLSHAPKCAQGYELIPSDLYDELNSNKWHTHERWAVTRKKQLSKKELVAAKLVNSGHEEVYHG